MFLAHLRRPGPRGRRRPVLILVAAGVVAAGIAAAVVFSDFTETGLSGLDFTWPWSRKPEALDPKAPIDPARQYHLSVWDYELPFRSPGGAPFSDAARRAIERFERRYPNVKVDLTVLDPADGQAKLAEALQAGYPPDVYCSPFGPGAVGSDYQVPVGLYLDYDIWAGYDPVAWQTVKVEGTVWSYPRWLMLWPWLGNRELLAAAGVDTARVAAEGWTRDEFAAAIVALAGTGRQARPSVAATSPAVVLRDLLLPGHLAGETPQPADLYWLGAEPGAVALWLSELRDAGALAEDGRGTNPGVIDSFVHGRTSILVAPSPWATMFILEPVRRPPAWEFSLPPRDRPAMVLLPPPHAADQPSAVWVSAATVSVFRQARYKGDDHTRLAAELARELSVGTRPWLRDQPLCIPAAYSEQVSWRLRVGRYGQAGEFATGSLHRLAELPKDRLSLALSALTYGPRPPIPSDQPEPGDAGTGLEVRGKEPAGPRLTWGYLGPFLAETVAPAAADFWAGRTGPGDLVSELTEGILTGD
ncbi:MAG: extracellular solute-binding protein [Bacillota bacterium]|nr:MAG: extracellular solute-binding protein [Bacillota bacterium]